MKQKYAMEQISQNRGTIYALAMLWLMALHLSVRVAKPLFYLQELGEVGVDIFLFVSGISLHFSMRKGETLRIFYRRRFLRIALPALLVGVPWFSAYYFIERDILAWLFNILGLTLFYSGTKATWFITAICLCYWIYPLVYRLYEAIQWRGLALALAVSLLLNGVISRLDPYFFARTAILWCRIPIFLVGAFCGKLVYEKKTLPFTRLQIVIASAVCAVICARYKDTSELYVYLYIPMAICFTMLFSMAGKWQWGHTVGKLLSPITLEVYLLQEKINVILGKTPLRGNALALNAAAIVLTIFGAYLLCRVEKAILRKVGA